MQGTTSTQLNVRAEPSTTSDVLGIIAANQSVQIVGQDPGGNWWQIVYETGAGGKGWVTAQYVETASKPEVPVIGGDEANPNLENSAVVIQQLNIRSGPGTRFNSLGILNANDVVNLTGRNRDGMWLQIEFANGAGWINAAFVKSDAMDGLPIVSDLGEVVGTGTLMDTPLPPTPTVVPAPIDFDSADAPLKTILFDRAGTQTLIYNGDVSVPNGDAEDWIQFTSQGNIVSIQATCTDAPLRVELWNDGKTVDDFSCGEAVLADVVPGGSYVLRLIQTGTGYTGYVLNLEGIP